MVDLTVKIGGEAGFGIMTTGLLLGKIATRSGYHTFEYSEYPSLIRGSHNVIEVRISDEEVHSQEKKVDILVCLNLDTLQRHVDELKDQSIVVIDKSKEDITKVPIKGKNVRFLDIPLDKIIKENKLKSVVKNNIALGVVVYLLGADLSIFDDLIEDNFKKKGQKVIDGNILAAKLGFEHARAIFKDRYGETITRKTDIKQKMYITGNEMVGLGAIAAGCKLYVAYPMTPASTVLHYLASKSSASGMVVKHAEDEISVINMALGGSFAGVRTMVGTSGGGFALMVESVALAGITETPVVIFLAQRPGPATGMPTWTEQGDLLFVINSGHGEFPKIVLTPSDVEECFELTIKAFNLAEKYQTPVFVLSDKYLSEGHMSIDRQKITGHKYSIDRGKLLSEEELTKLEKYERYKITNDGISPRALPGMKGSLHQANSYEHVPDGHTTEEAEDRIAQVDKRHRKTDTYLNSDFQMPILYGSKDAPLTLVAWGSTKLPVLQAMKEKPERFNLLHFNHVWPMDGKRLQKEFSKYKKFLLVENNSTGQFGNLLRMIAGIQIEEKLLKYSGRPIYPEDVLKKINSLS